MKVRIKIRFTGCHATPRKYECVGCGGPVDNNKTEFVTGRSLGSWRCRNRCRSGKTKVKVTLVKVN